MAAKNDITGDSIISRHSKAYEENITRIFGDKTEEKERKAREKAEYFARLAAETKARMDNTGVTKNEYQDVLSTEDCMEYDAPVTRYNQETQEVLKYNK